MPALIEYLAATRSNTSVSPAMGAGHAVRLTSNLWIEGDHPQCSSTSLARSVLEHVRYTGAYHCHDGRVHHRMGEVTARVESAIRDMIASGDLPNGRLPSERTLAADLQAGRTTIRLVLMKLASEGLVRSEHGRAYFVCEDDESPETA